MENSQIVSIDILVNFIPIAALNSSIVVDFVV